MHVYYTYTCIKNTVNIEKGTYKHLRIHSTHILIVENLKIFQVKVYFLCIQQSYLCFQKA